MYSSVIFMFRFDNHYKWKKQNQYHFQQKVTEDEPSSNNIAFTKVNR